MDLSSIKAQTLKVEIIHPGSNKPTGLVVECTSRADPRVKKIERQHLDKLIRLRGRKTTAAEVEERQLESIVARIVGFEWQGDASWGGKKLDASPENIRTLLAEDWLKRQVEEAIGDEADFFTN
jgi:hypothetical protein